MTPKHLGILGGMGPVATAQFYEHVIQGALARGAKRDAEFPRISLSSAVIPGFDSNGFEDADAVRTKIIESARELESCGVSLIAMPCNTAHAFYDGLSASVRVPVLNMIEITLTAVRSANVKQVAILGTPSTVEEEVYTRPDINFVPLTSEEQDIATMLISRGEEGLYDASDTTTLSGLATTLGQRGAQGIILGCTELSGITLPESSIPFFDSSRLLAETAVKMCYEN